MSIWNLEIPKDIFDSPINTIDDLNFHEIKTLSDILINLEINDTNYADFKIKLKRLLELVENSDDIDPQIIYDIRDIWIKLMKVIYIKNLQTTSIPDIKNLTMTPDERELIDSIKDIIEDTN